jgi:class 3 adenylate cyclase
VCLALAYAVGLSFYKSAMLERFAERSQETLSRRHAGVLNLFQASFYFFYEDQFHPGIRQALATTPDLERIQILSGAGALLFDSAAPRPASSGEAASFAEPEIVARLGGSAPAVYVGGFRVRILMPSGQYGVLYTFNGSTVRGRLLAALGLGLALGAAVFWGLPRARARLRLSGVRWGRAWGLRTKFLSTIVLINLITGGIVFVTLSALQTREETQRIRKESILFSQFSTAQVISDFSNFFYFYYADKFLPGMKTIVATNENLLGVRIISRRSGAVLFDTEQAASGPVPPAAAPQLAEDAPKAELPAEVEAELKTRDVIARDVVRGGVKLLSVINTYRNENQEALFLVEYTYTFQTLERSIAAIRRQILIDLVPSLALGLLIAVAFAQLLISPIRRLVGALKQVTSGDFDVSVDIRRGDEIGDLVTAFNSMTGELRRKRELRKYLSDSTYRQIMEAPEVPGGVRIGGARVAATVLFSDIRDFVSHCESLEAEEVTAMLNEYFSEMVEVVYKHGGEVDKFIGDALLAVFYDSDETNTALQAMYCALEMRERLREFNQRRAEKSKRHIEIGVGITRGELISGPIGSKDRMDFTVIGDVVNLANRIEKLSKKGKRTKIVFSQHVEDRVRGLLEYEELSAEAIRGKEEAITVFELVRIRDLDSLMRNIRGADPALRRRSVELLGHSRNRDAIPHVLETLGDADEEIRLRSVAAAAKLAERNEARVLDALFARFEVEGSDKVVSALLSAVGKVCTDDRILAIARFLDSPNERVVANAVEAMGQVRSPRCSDLILPKLSSRNNRVKANAAMALFAAGHIEVIDTLKPMLMHSDPLMRSSAAFAIGELTMLAQKDKLLETWKTRTHGVKLFLAELQECVPMLVSLLKDGEPMVKRQAIVALGKIKDRSAVLPIIDNVDLEKDSKEILREVGEALRAIGSHKLVREVLAKLQ